MKPWITTGAMVLAGIVTILSGVWGGAYALHLAEDRSIGWMAMPIFVTTFLVVIVGVITLFLGCVDHIDRVARHEAKKRGDR